MKIEILINWIHENIVKRQNINYDYDTSHIRTVFMHDTGIYVSNEEVNDAMLHLGYKISTPMRDLYLHFDISSRSPALRKYRNEILGSH